MSIRSASRFYEIPRTTLQDRLHGRVDEETFSFGRHTVLNEIEKQALVDWLINLQSDETEFTDVTSVSRARVVQKS